MSKESSKVLEVRDLSQEFAAPTQTVAAPVYEAAVKGRRDFREAYRKQRDITDRYILVLKMIREGVQDPKGLATKILAERAPNLTDEEDTVKSYFDDALGESAPAAEQETGMRAAAEMLDSIIDRCNGTPGALPEFLGFVLARAKLARFGVRKAFEAARPGR